MRKKIGTLRSVTYVFDDKINNEVITITGHRKKNSLWEFQVCFLNLRVTHEVLWDYESPPHVDITHGWVLQCMEGKELTPGRKPE